MSDQGQGVKPGVIAAPITGKPSMAAKSNGSAGMPASEINPFIAGAGGKVEVKSGTGSKFTSKGRDNGFN